MLGVVPVGAIAKHGRHVLLLLPIVVVSRMGGGCLCACTWRLRAGGAGGLMRTGTQNGVALSGSLLLPDAVPPVAEFN